jgi:hypothetical protein
MAGEHVHELIKEYQARHPGMSYRAAYDAVVHDENADSEVLVYKAGAPGDAETIAALETELRHLAGERLYQLMKAERKKSRSDYRTAFVEVARANPEIAKSYGYEAPSMPPKDKRAPVPSTWRSDHAAWAHLGAPHRQIR